ncbi:MULTISPECIES: type II toxin-antitoxin system RelE/ParE family toxin [Vibrio]|uniref:Toxin n=1 Tax=Vibrio casei TaxID=673372 RepID=A0A368LFI9_9VIBR|nr:MULTISPECIES: type II toxin-antitoxin system RelE/ParE family toxin [Vibrio]RCS68337.1 type II toxin-antitoxin system RelE/ParE family toxin [Vibrio casei]SJN41371.1 ParE toxin protein [Vibrio casei]HBV77422.1 type II toxin-antitoxin system RelE/ParE family toxin [Vibrio sp.]
MAKYKISSAAQADFIEIRRYTLKHWGLTQWVNYFSELKQCMALLANNEQMGIAVTELGEHYYRFPLKNHVIYYIRKPDHIVIAAVLGKYMSPSKHFTELN